MRTKLFAILLTVFALATWAKAQDSERVKVGDPMPAFTITEDDGTRITSDRYKGKAVLVTFFATWCPPCQKELAEYQKTLWPKYKGNPDFALLVIGREHSSAELEKYNRKKGFTFPLYPDKNRAIYNAFAQNLIPRCYLVDKQGKVVYVGKGFEEKEFARLMEQIDNVLKQK